VARRGRLIRVRASANAFLHHMIRNIVGTLLYVGLGRRAREWPAEVLAARDRAQAAPTFSPAGLYLVRVEYDPSFQLPAPLTPVPAWLNAYSDQDLRTDA